MKKTLLILLAVIMAVAIASGTLISVTGYGKVVTATTTPAVIDLPDEATYWSVDNLTGSETIYVMKNATTNTFVLTNAIPVQAGSAYASEKPSRINKICYATATNTSAVAFAFE